MKRTLSILLVVALLVGLMAPAMAFAMSNPNTRFVKTGNGKPLNVRSGPGTNNEVFFTLPYGTMVEVIDTHNDWCLIKPYDEKLWKKANYSTNMWVMKSLLSTQNPGQWVAPAGPTYEDVDAAVRLLKPLETPYLAEIITDRPTNYVHLRWIPNTSARFSAQYLAGEKILVLAESQYWAQVMDLQDGLVGFILKKNVNPMIELQNELMAEVQQLFEAFQYIGAEADGAAQ